MTGDALVRLQARQSIEDRVVSLFVATDARDWPAVEACFTDPLTLDMTSVEGGEPRALSPRELTTTWAQNFKPLDHVHHQIGNVQTTLADGNAIVRCHGFALHHRTKVAGGKTRLFVGTYEFALIANEDAWKISRMTFRLAFIDGNASLESAF